MNTHTAQPSPEALANATAEMLRELDSEIEPLAHDAPRVPFPSALRLPRGREDALADFLKKWFEDLDQELGRTATDCAQTAATGTHWYLSKSKTEYERHADTFFGKRLLYDLTFRNKLDWRPGALGGIFDKCNLTLSTSRRITSQRLARFRKYFFDAQPWWAAEPIKPKNDKIFARTLLKIADIKLNDSGSAAVFGNAVGMACVAGEAILHITRAVDDDHYEEEIVCWLDTDGQPIPAGDGDYITEDDTWEMSAGEMALTKPKPDGSTTAVPVEGEEILQRDPTTRRNGGVITTPAGSYTLSRMDAAIVPRRAVHYQGPRTVLIDTRDFLCPLGAADIHTAACIVHLDRIAVSEIAQQYAANPSADTVRQAVDLLKNAIAGTTASVNAPSVSQPRASLDESASEAFEPITQYLNVGHFYFKGDPAGTGITSDIYCLMDVDTWTPIYYHYTAAVSPTRRRPYRVIRTEEVSGRWFGLGEMERFDYASNLIDRFLNTAAYAQSASSVVKFWRPDRTEEGKGKKGLVLDPSVTYTPIGDYTGDQILQTVPLLDIKSGELQQMLEIIQQAATIEAGTSTANDAAMAGLPTQKTATGNNIIQSAGSELTSLPIAILRTGLQSALDDFVVTCFRFHDHTETFTILEGDVPVEMQLTKPETANLRVNVRILLTSYYAEQEQEKRLNALGVANQFHDYALTDPGRQPIMAGMYVDTIQSMGTENAPDYIIPRIMPAMPEGEPSSQPSSQPSTP